MIGLDQLGCIPFLWGYIKYDLCHQTGKEKMNKQQVDCHRIYPSESSCSECDILPIDSVF